MSLRWALAWIGVGAAWALTLVGALTIGPFVLPFAAAATILLARVRAARPAAPAIMTGLALPFLYVAWLNRDGPGTVCHAIARGEQCDDRLNPLPWLFIAAVLGGCGITATTLAVRRDRARVREG